MNRKMLEKEFPINLIKDRKGPGNINLDYVESANYIRRLNDAFDGQWSFEIKHHERIENQIVVLGCLTAEEESKEQFGSKEIIMRNDIPVDIGSDYKAATSDALKKCATLFGIGLHLYSKEMLATNFQVEEIQDLLNEYGKSEQELNACITQIHGIQRKSAKLDNLTAQEAKEVIRFLEQRIKQRKEAAENVESNSHQSEEHEN